MTEDIVSRLHRKRDEESRPSIATVLHDAADEIARLRDEVRRVPLGHITTLCELEVASEEIERLRAAGDALHAAISALPIQRFDEGLAVINAMHDWDGVRNA